MKLLGSIRQVRAAIKVQTGLQQAADDRQLAQLRADRSLVALSQTMAQPQKRSRQQPPNSIRNQPAASMSPPARQQARPAAQPSLADAPKPAYRPAPATQQAPASRAPSCWDMMTPAGTDGQLSEIARP